MESTPKQQTRSKDADLSPSSMLSPSLASRREERDAMAHLNNRLAAYVDKVRSLETENSRLRSQITSYSDTSKQEVNNIKMIYEGELAETKRLLDELSKEKAQLLIDNQNLSEKAENDRSMINTLTQSNSVYESKLKSTTAMLHTERNTSSSLLKERDAYKDDTALLKSQVNDVQEELETHRKMLATETVQRVDFENKLQSAKEEIQFKAKIHNEELSEARKIHSFKISEVDATVKANYESKLEATIIDLREQHTMELEQMRDDLDAEYSNKVTSLVKNLEQFRDTQGLLKASELKAGRLQNTVQSLQLQMNNISNRAQDLEGQVETERQLRISAVTDIEKERDEIKDTLAGIEKEFADLLDLKLKLDHEIGVYRKLLEEEESRLNMSPSPMVGSTGSDRRRLRRKRKRIAQEADKKKDDGEEDAKKKCGSEDVLHEKGDGPEGTNNCLIM